MTNEEINEKIESVCESYQGQFPDLFQMVGIVAVGHLFGWRVVRLVVPKRIWTLTLRWFGDPKLWMPPRGRLVHKSVGLKIADQLGDYWDVINGDGIKRDSLPNDKRKGVI